MENGFSLKATCGEPLNRARFLDNFLTLLDPRDFVAIQAIQELMAAEDKGASSSWSHYDQIARRQRLS